ncbi:MAG: ectoine hydroxylase [Gammaproteobacteria bacterium]
MTAFITATANTLDGDRYPSRQRGQKAAMVERLDPVVHAEDSAPAPLPAALVEQYRTQGYLILDELFSEAEAALWLAELQRLRQDPEIRQREETITERGSNAVRSIFAVHRLSPLMGRLARDPRLLRLAEYLLGDAVYMHQSRLNYKPGLRGREFYWHSDFETWHVEDGMPAMRALSMSITLTENLPTNGPLLLIPGSHRTFVACEGETPEQHFRESLKKQEYGVPDDASLARLVEENGIVEFLGKPGSVCLFDCNIMHGSNSNISPFARSNAFFVYNAMGNRVGAPFSGQAPRPEYICSRNGIVPLVAAGDT